MKRKMTGACLLLLAAGLLLSACSAKNAAGTSADRVVMTYVSSPLNVPSVLEKERGDYAKAFAELGLSFGYSDLTSGADQTAALASGDIHILNAVGCAPVLLAAANGADIAIVSMYSRAPKAYAIFSADDSIRTPADLKGKTVAGPKGTNLHELLAAYLSSAGMSMQDVNFVSMDIPSAVAALESGSVDVALAGGAAAYQCEKSGKHKITDGEGLIAAGIVTAVSRKFAAQNPQIVETFRRTQQKIVADMESDPETAVRITAEKLDLEPEAVREMMALYDFSTDVREEDIKQMEETERFLYDSGMIEEHVDVRGLFL